MINKFYFLYTLLILFSCQQKTKMPEISHNPYPNTKKINKIDDYFGTKISDPYQWLEYDTAKEVENWVNEQNKVTEHYLSQISFRQSIKKRLNEIWNFEKFSAPFEQGGKLYFYKNNGLQNQSVLYVQDNEQAEPKVFLDPNTLSKDGTTSLNGIRFSKNNQYIAYSTSKAGSDWQTIHIKDLKSNTLLSETIEWTKFGGAAWFENGFYYSGYDIPKAGQEFSAANQFQKIFYHKLGTPQSEDILVFEDKKHPLRYYFADVSYDETLLYINISEGTSGGEILVKDLKDKNSKFITLYKGFEFNPSVIGNMGNEVLILTDENAPNYQLIRKDILSNHTKVIIPNQTDLLEHVSFVNGKLLASYQHNVSSRLVQYDINGKQEHEIKLDEIGTVSGFGGNPDQKQIYYYFTSFTQPGQVFKYHIETKETKLVKSVQFPMDLSQFETKQIFYNSKDGTKIPMFIICKKGIKLDGKNPTLLYGYGGFNISITPSFGTAKMIFLENGGIFAIANLRGGGEFGENWHKAGMLEKKQNVFDDFIAAAQYLIDQKYTNSNLLAISGRSNGGLLVGACMTQRPELFKAALPGVGVLDMLKYHKFTVGWGWAVEYGSSDNKTQFDYLIKYSPLHCVKKNVNYPATLITTGDHDDRVVPAHSFKFAATLQENQNPTGNPILIRIDKQAGHGAGKPTSKLIEEESDVWSFVFYQLGITL